MSNAIRFPHDEEGGCEFKSQGDADERAGIYRSLAEHQQSEPWAHRALLIELHRWAEIFNREFALAVPEFSLAIDRLRCTRLGHFRCGHNGFGLKGEIVINRNHLGREFWQVLDFELLEGRPFTAEDERNANFVAVITETTRRRFFGGKPALGKTLEADGQRFRVVGVVPDVPVLRTSSSADLWVPISTAKSSAYKEKWMGEFIGLILARGRADLPAVKAELEARRGVLLVLLREVPADAGDARLALLGALELDRLTSDVLLLGHGSSPRADHGRDGPEPRF